MPARYRHYVAIWLQLNNSNPDQWPIWLKIWTAVAPAVGNARTNFGLSAPFSFWVSKPFTRVIPKVSGLDISDNNNFNNLYISETYTLYELWRDYCKYDVIVIHNANRTELISLLHDNFPVCSAICKSGALGHLILWKPWQICSWISHLNWWI